MYVCVYIINLSSVNVLTESSIFLFLCFLIASNQSAYYIKGSLMLLKVELDCQSLKLFSCCSCILRVTVSHRGVKDHVHISWLD